MYFRLTWNYYVKDHLERLTPFSDLQSAGITGVCAVLGIQPKAPCIAGHTTQLTDVTPDGLYNGKDFQGIFILLFLICVCLSVYMYAHMGVGALRSEALDPLELALQAIMRHHTLGCWELNSRPLQEQ